MGDKNKLVEESLEFKDTREVCKYKGKFRIIGIITGSPVYIKNIDVNDAKYANHLTFIVLSEEDGVFKNCDMNLTKSLLRTFKFSNAELVPGPKGGSTIKITECAVSRIPQYVQCGRYGRELQLLYTIDSLVSYVTILARLFENDKFTGFRILNNRNMKIMDVTDKQLMHMVDNGTYLVNGKVVRSRTTGDMYISAIMSEFSQVHLDNNSKSYSKETARKLACREYIYSLKRVKLKKWSCHVLRKSIGLQDRMTRYYTSTFLRFEDGIIYVPKVIKVLMTEVVTPEIINKMTEKDKALYAGLLTKVRDDRTFKDPVVIDKRMPDPKGAVLWAIIACQFILYDEEVYKEVTSAGCYRSDGIDETFVKALVDKGLCTEIFMNLVNKKKAFVPYKKPEYTGKLKEFNQTEFKKTRQIAELGFAISIDNDGIEYEKEVGGTIKLKYIGKWVDEFSDYKAIASSFGDVCVLAQIGRTIDAKYFSDEEKAVRIEVMLAIMAIYRPDIVRKFIKNNRYCLSNYLDGILPGLASIPVDKRVDFGLSSELKVYYESGFNVFLSDHDIQGYDNLPHYKYHRKGLVDAEYINYRSLGNMHVIGHPMLYEELAPVVNMMTSSKCTMKDIERCIGNLRVL